MNIFVRSRQRKEILSPYISSTK